MREDLQLISALLNAQKQCIELHQAYAAGRWSQSDVALTQRVLSEASSACVNLITSGLLMTPKSGVKTYFPNCFGQPALHQPEMVLADHSNQEPSPYYSPHVDYSALTTNVSPIASPEGGCIVQMLTPPQDATAPDVPSSWERFNTSKYSVDSWVLPSDIYRMWYFGTQSIPAVVWMDQRYSSRHNWVSTIKGLREKLESKYKIVHRIECTVEEGHNLMDVLASADRVLREIRNTGILEQLCETDPRIFT